jgi:SagB-type dehydrogenase family enzyme
VSRAADRIEVDLVLASGLVVADSRIDRSVRREKPSELAADVEWILTPGANSHLSGSQLTIAFDLLPDDVFVEGSRTSVVSTRRTIEVEFDEVTLGHLIEGLSIGQTAEVLTDTLPADVRDPAREVLADLVGWEAVVPLAGARLRRAHEWSMRGARARGRLSPFEVEELTFNPEPPARDSGALVELAPVRLPPIDSLSGVLRRRRSAMSYGSSPILLDELAQLLGLACGITGELVIEDRRLPLRAYPSPGALYAVDVFIIPARVTGLRQGVFQYDPNRHVLSVVSDEWIDAASLCLPDVRGVVEGAAAFIALSINLARATQKYGDESYRILVAEAGCIAENLVLVAHALALRAGPFTGVFDRLVDKAIGQKDASFVVGVLVGHARTQ